MVLEREEGGREERLWGGRDSCKEDVVFIIVFSADLEEDGDEDNIKDWETESKKSGIDVPG